MIKNYRQLLGFFFFFFFSLPPMAKDEFSICQIERRYIVQIGLFFKTIRLKLRYFFLVENEPYCIHLYLIQPVVAGL